MNTEISPAKPYGLFRYLYNHYQVRYPDYHRFVEPLLPTGDLDAVNNIEPDSLEPHLETNIWLIGIARPELAESVLAHWGSMSPLARGNYLAGFTERTYFGCLEIESRLQFIKEQLRELDSIELTGETACEIGCCLLGMDLSDEFMGLLGASIDWEQEVDRASARDAKRWKTINKLSKRIIDVFLEAALVLKRPSAVQVLLERGADPNIHIWQLERSSNGLYPALSYTIKNGILEAVDSLLEHGADPRGSALVENRSPLALAFWESDFVRIKQLLAAGASLEDGPRYEEAPTFYAMNAPVEWVREQLSELLGLLPIDGKAIFHTPNAQGGFYFTLLQCLWDDAEKIRFAEEIGMDLRLTEYEMARLIQWKEREALSLLLGRLGESVKNKALDRIQKEFADW